MKEYKIANKIKENSVLVVINIDGNNFYKGVLLPDVKSEDNIRKAIMDCFTSAVHTVLIKAK